MSELPLQASNVPKAFDPARNPGGASSGSAGPAPFGAKSMQLLRQSLLLRLYYCVCWMDPGKEGLFLLARDDLQIIGWMDGFYYKGFDS